MGDFRSHSWATVYYGPESIVVAASAWKGFGVGVSGAATLTSLDEDDAAIGQLILDTIRSNPREVELEDVKVIKARLRQVAAMLGFPGKSANAVADSALLGFDDNEVVATLWKAKPRGGAALDALRLGTPAADPAAIGSLIRQCHVRLATEAVTRSPRVL
ncbi:MAG: hypothetical protein AB7O74_17130 [Candidatus Nanopelagicales bacterium]